MNEISPREARRIFLHSQGLLRPTHFGRGKAATLRAIDRIGYVQIDTISVVERAHHHVLRSRVPNYTGEMLDSLQAKDRDIFEYWSHAAAYLPMQNYRYYLPIMKGSLKKRKPDAKLAREIIRRLDAEGPLQSRDFEFPGGRKSNGWWDWKPAKLALESMFLGGQLMVTRREGFQKVYDLPQNVLPPDVDTTEPTIEEWATFLAESNIRALGIGTSFDVGYARLSIRRLCEVQIQPQIVKSLNALVEKGRLVEVMVNGTKHYADPTQLEQLPLRLGRRQVTVLSPFDNVIINRERLQRLFDFDYQIECYVPEPKRRFGYFCLPLLYGDELIGRIDSKAVRAKGLLQIRSIHMEPGTRINDALLDAMVDGVARFAEDNRCEEIQLPDESSLSSSTIRGNLNLS
jgi:uncharacterized protein YcaQ